MRPPYQPGEVLVLLARDAQGEYRPLIVELEARRFDEWRVRVRSADSRRGILCSPSPTREGAICAAMGFRA